MSAEQKVNQDQGEIWSKAEEALASLIQDAYELLQKSQPEKSNSAVDSSVNQGSDTDNVQNEEEEEVNNSLELVTPLDSLELEDNPKTYDLSTSEGKNSFTQACLDILVKIQEAITDFISTKEVALNSDEPPDILGIRDLKVVHTLLEVVVIWGIYPCLQDGVGVSLSKRVRSGFVQSEFFDKEGSTALQFKEKNTKLLEILRKLFSMSKCSSGASHFTTVSSIILSRHLTDMYAGLLQLAFGPLTEKNVPQQANDSSNDGPKIQINPGSSLQRPVDFANIWSAASTKKPDTRVLSPSEREECISEFEDLFQRADAFKSLESLTLLLGSPLNPSPRWLSNVCGRYLTQILLKPSGVNVGMLVILDAVVEGIMGFF
ncbi:hypothetical protein K7432_007976 [Basidiobolus ranarum]|uniref:TANGO6 N-terminal domain-containing protein n=1 Tax=Basidiobolus ranarum TaxID=34480 RepID=A0ABR2WSG5_9FUNG